MWQIQLGIWQRQPLKAFFVSWLLFAADKMCFFVFFCDGEAHFKHAAMPPQFTLLSLRNEVTEENKNG